MFRASISRRAEAFTRARAFFAERDIVEVDCDALRPAPALDAHIEPIVATACGQRHYLHTSPEYGMKQLLSQGSGDIYQLGHVFRDGEWGALHRPEFTMAEWYRVGFSFQQMIDETVAFVQQFVGTRPVRQMTYREAFLSFTGSEVPPLEVRHQRLIEEVEPHFVGEPIWVITHFPADEAALANVEGEWALRFEIYHRGVELANGYDELSDVDEHRHRLSCANRKREVPLPLDRELFETLQRGLPPCCGVAVGFDRLLMLGEGRTTL